MTSETGFERSKVSTAARYVTVADVLGFSEMTKSCEQHRLVRDALLSRVV